MCWTDLWSGSAMCVARRDRALPVSWQQLTVQIGDKTIIHPVDGTVKDGTACALMGPTGSGKSEQPALAFHSCCVCRFL